MMSASQVRADSSRGSADTLCFICSLLGQHTGSDRIRLLPTRRAVLGCSRGSESPQVRHQVANAPSANALAAVRLFEFLNWIFFERIRALWPRLHWPTEPFAAIG